MVTMETAKPVKVSWPKETTAGPYTDLGIKSCLGERTGGLLKTQIYARAQMIINEGFNNLEQKWPSEIKL